MNDKLPYSFDLCFDIKTVEELRTVLRKAREELDAIEGMCREEGYEDLLQ